MYICYEQMSDLGDGQFRRSQESPRHLFGMRRDLAQVVTAFFGNLMSNGANFIYNCSI